MQRRRLHGRRDLVERWGRVLRISLQERVEKNSDFRWLNSILFAGARCFDFLVVNDRMNQVCFNTNDGIFVRARLFYSATRE